MAAGAAIDKAADRSPFLHHKGIFRGKIRVAGEKLMEFFFAQGCKALLYPRRIPQGMQRIFIFRFVVSYHIYFSILNTAAPTGTVGAANLADQPLTAPMVTPSIKYFCSAKNSTNMGSAEMVAPAIMGANKVSFANLNCFRPT